MSGASIVTVQGSPMRRIESVRFAATGRPGSCGGGYQIDVAFDEVVLQGFGTAVSATVVCDRLIGVFLGLVVFGIIEQCALARAGSRTRSGLGWRRRCACARTWPRARTRGPGSVDTAATVDAASRRIADGVRGWQGSRSDLNPRS